MKIVVTGGEGFFGSHIVDALIARGDDVVVLDHHKREKVRFPNPRATMYAYGIGEERVAEMLRQESPDALVHLAAQISVTKSLADPLLDAEKNILDALRLMEWAKDAGVGQVVFASSGGAIYGDHPTRPTPLLPSGAPLSPYGITKLLFEQFLEYYSETHGMRVAALRYANLYGPRQQVVRPYGEGSLIPLFLHRLLVTHEPLTIFGDGSTTRDFVYVDDAVSALLCALNAKDDHLVVNVSTGVPIAVSDVVKKLEEVHGAPHPITYERFRDGEVRHSVLDPTSAEEKLHWKAKTSFHDGLKRTYEWFKKTFGGS